MPNLIVACSAGAIIGALYAERLETESLKQQLFAAQSTDFLPDFPILFFRFGLSDGYWLNRYLLQHLKARTFSELQIPLVVVATDLSDGELRELYEGELIPSVMASAAFAGVFEPVKLHGRYLVD